jgi:hypothetical protein
MAEATQRLQQDKLRASMGMAIRTLALQRAMWATEHKFKDTGIEACSIPPPRTCQPSRAILKIARS